MDWTVIANGVITCAGMIANAVIVNCMGNKMLAKSKKELQQMQQEHEKEMQERQQNFKTFLLNTKETKEQKEKSEKEKQKALDDYRNGIAKFLSYTYDDSAFAQATGAYMNILKYTPSSLHKKITDLNNMILTIHNTYDSYDENGNTINRRTPLEIEASNMFAQICQEWNSF